MRATSASDRAAADAESTLRAILETQEAHLEMLGRWTPPTSEVPVSLLRAAQREDAPPDYGWSAHAALAGVYNIPGDHFGVVRPPHIETTARYLTELLHLR
jgi:thioesterase domain-containing protein